VRDAPRPDIDAPTVGQLEDVAKPSNGHSRLTSAGLLKAIAHSPSGLADLLPTFRAAVYVELSVRSLVMAPSLGEDFVLLEATPGRRRTLGLVDVSIFPHLDHGAPADNSMADGSVEVVAEGHWKLFTA
jgi:dipeptidase E